MGDAAVRASIHEISSGLWLVDLDQDRPGYHRFVSAWVHDDGALRYVVDPGPASTIPHLLRALDELGVTGLDLVLLTHVHIDHAGGVGHLLRARPDARVVASERARKHLLDPTRLWEGSKKVLGDLADLYGEIAPVPGAALAPADAAGAAGIRVVPTPGHAPHHVAFLHHDVLFGGEVAGTRAPVGDGVYRRPATPPRFIEEVAIESIERLLGDPDLPSRFAFGHWGLDPDARTSLERGREQIRRWVDTVRAATVDADPDEPLDAFVERVMPELLALDTGFAGFDELAPDVRSRERTFIANSIAGMRAYVRSPEA